MDPSIIAWRRQHRARLLALRQAVPGDERARAAETIAQRLDEILTTTGVASIGLYWPIKHEINLTSWAATAGKRRPVTLCLPVVVTPHAPLEYWRWTSGDSLVRGFWNIPVPAQRDPVLPELVLAPLVGFDQARYRLGYGGGYFDRTLASLSPRPVAIGIGYDFGGLETISPQPHDIAMDAILTDRRAMLPSDWSTHAD